MNTNWYKENKERHYGTCKAWAKNHPNKVKEIQKRYRDKHKEKIRQYQKQYGVTAKGIYSYLRKHRERALFSITREEFIGWYQSQVKECFYCGIPENLIPQFPKFFNGTVNRRLSIDRMDNKRGYEPGNIVLSCRRCNGIKSDFFSAQEMKEIAQKFLTPKWKEA